LLCWSSCLQVFIKSTPELESTPKHTIFGLFFIGAFLVALIAFIFGSTEKMPTTSVQWGIYLGAVASGAGYFFWNKVLLR
jgi:drug/metabolite transporter (DMT)-like permease